MRGAEDTSAKLVELRETKTFGSLDQYDGRVRDVHAHFNDRSRDENIAFPALTLLHSLFFLQRFHFSVQYFYRCIFKYFPFQARRLCFH